MIVTRSALGPVHALVALALPLLAGCRGAPAPDQAAAGALPVVAVRTVVATIQPVVRTVSVTGTVVARPGSYAVLSAPAATRVSRVFVSAGDVVRQGAPLVAFDRTAFDAAYGQAAAGASAARLAAERAQRLAVAGIAPRKDVERAMTARAQADAALAVARRQRELSTLHAPLAGVVSRMNAVLDGSVDINQPLVEIVDPAALELLLMLGEADAGAVRPGAPVTFASSAADAPGSGTVTTVAPTLDSVSRGVAVRVRVARPAHALRIGESVTAQIALESGAPVLAVPVAALVPDADGFKVFVRDSAGIAHARPVQIGARTATLAAVTSGLNPGDEVVTEGAYGLEDGSKTNRLPPPSPTAPAPPAR